MSNDVRDYSKNYAGKAQDVKTTKIIAEEIEGAIEASVETDTTALDTTKYLELTINGVVYEVCLKA